MQHWRHRLAVKQAPLKVIIGLLQGESGPAVRGRAYDGQAAPAPARSVARAGTRHTKLGPERALVAAFEKLRSAIVVMKNRHRFSIIKMRPSPHAGFGFLMSAVAR